MEPTTLTGHAADDAPPRVVHLDTRSLYHGTSILNAALIVDGDALHGQWDEVGDDYQGVSTSADFVRAHRYGIAKTAECHEDFGNGCYGLAPGISRDILPTDGAVLTLDAPALLRDHRIHRVRWQPSEPLEERVIGDIKPLRPYLAGIVADRRTVARWIDILRRTMALPDEMHGNNGTIKWVPEGIRRQTRALERLLTHPLLRSDSLSASAASRGIDRAGGNLPARRTSIPNQERTIPVPDPSTISTITRVHFPKNGSAPSLRCLAWHRDLAEAQRCVLYNHLGILDTTFSHIVIEQTPPGLYPRAVEHWYVWAKTGYVPCERPDEARANRAWAIG